MSGRYIINEKITEYIDGIYNPPDALIGELRTEAEEKGIPVILRDTERFMITLIRMLRPSRILEIGTAIGYSSICFSKAAGADTEIVTLEREDYLASQAETYIKKLGYDKQITVVRGDARESLLNIDGIFDLVFIDAAKSHYGNFWDLCLPHCKSGSIIVCDNVLLRGSVTDEGYDSSPRKHHTSIKRMRLFLERITTDPSVETVIMTVGDGLSVSYLKAVDHE